jgi:hypothetical protein
MDGKVRVAYANVVVDEAGKTTLSFQADAWVRARFPHGSGPRVSLMFLDAKKAPLGAFREVAIARVEACFGRQSHEVPLDKGFPRAIIERAESFTLKMSAASEVGC